MADTEQPKVVLSPDSAGDDKDKITFMQPKIAQINQRTLTSNCHSSLNRYRFRIIYGFRLEQKNLNMKKIWWNLKVHKSDAAIWQCLEADGRKGT